MKTEDGKIDWDKWRVHVKGRAKEFVEAKEIDRVWYIGGEILDSAVICSAWDDNILKVCEWVLVNGKGAQPDIAEFLIDRNDKWNEVGRSNP